MSTYRSIVEYYDQSVPGFLVTPFTHTLIAPATALQSAGSTTVTCTGTGFVPSSMVYVDGVAVPTTYVSSTQVRGTFNTQTHSVGPHSIEVRNGYIVGDVPQTFTITAGVGMSNVESEEPQEQESEETEEAEDETDTSSGTVAGTDDES